MTDASAPPDNSEPRAEPGGGDVSAHPSIIIQGRALARIEAEMGANTGSEIGGVLVGNAAPSTNFVLVTGSLPAPGPSTAVADEIGPSGATVTDSTTDRVGFTLTAEILDDLTQQVAVEYPGQRIVGWYHSHPRFGVFLSEHDLEIQHTLFVRSWQVGYVYDPVQAQRGFFGWSGPEVARVPSWEVTSLTHASSIDLPVHAATPLPEPVATQEPATNVTPPPPPAFVSPESAQPLGHSDEPPSTGPTFRTAPPVPAKRKRPIGAIIGVIAAIVAITIAAIAIASSDDEDEGSTTDVSVPSSPGSDVSAPTADPTTTVSPAQSTVAVVPAASDAASDETTTTAEGSPTSPPSTAGAGVTTTEPTPITFPATPTSVQAPSTRVGASAVECTPSNGNTYEPTSDCFVPLNNGNIMVFVDGSLRCTDPAGAVVANEAQKFAIGIPADPLVLVADDVLNPTCIDLSYAKNVLADGSDTLDGLCGSSGTQINDATRRCLAANLASGAMAALVRSPQDASDLLVSCATATAQETTGEPTWTNANVGTSWRIDSVVYSAADNRFTATASKDGNTATTMFTCG